MEGGRENKKGRTDGMVLGVQFKYEQMPNLTDAHVTDSVATAIQLNYAGMTKITNARTYKQT